MIFYFVWVPLTIVFYILYSYISLKNNQEGGWFFILMILGCMPVWVIVSKYSKNLLFDGMLYDNLMFLTYVSTMLFLGYHDKLLQHQWLGLALIV